MLQNFHARLTPCTWVVIAIGLFIWVKLSMCLQDWGPRCLFLGDWNDSDRQLLVATALHFLHNSSSKLLTWLVHPDSMLGGPIHLILYCYLLPALRALLFSCISTSPQWRRITSLITSINFICCWFLWRWCYVTIDFLSELLPQLENKCLHAERRETCASSQLI